MENFSALDGLPTLRSATFDHDGYSDDLTCNLIIVAASSRGVVAV